MPVYVFGTAIVTLAAAANLREMSRRLDKGDCGGMFIVGLCPVGSPVGTVATRYISSGSIPQLYAQTLNSPTLLYTRGKAAWEADGDVYPYTQLQVTNAWNNCDLSNGTKQVTDPVTNVVSTVPESPWEMLTRLGLEPCRATLI